MKRSNQTMKDMVLTEYMNDSVKGLIKDIIKNTLNDPKETAFLMKCRNQSRRAMKSRTEHEKTDTIYRLF